MENNYLCYDWLSFTSKIHDLNSILYLLGLKDCDFEQKNGFYGYKDRILFNGVSVHYNGFSNKNGDMGILVEMSGQGCRTFEKYGNGDYDHIFSEIIDNYNDIPEQRQMNITRLDIAFDDFSGLLDLDLLSDETKKGNFVSTLKDFESRFGNKGHSVIHGSRTSNVYIRCYDKRLEQKALDRIDHWVRLEIQLRRENALGFIELREPFRKKYFLTLNHYLRYVVPTNNTTNKSMLDTAPYWINFLECAESRSIFHKPADSYDLLNLRTYVYDQVSGAVSTYIDVVGVEQFLKEIYESRKGKPLNTRYKAIKEENNAPGSGVLEYLKEHDLL